MNGIIGKNIKALRESHRLTQQQVADYLNIDRSTYTYYETKRTPCIDIVAKLASFYGVSIDFIVFGTAENGKILFSSPDENDSQADLFKLTTEERNILYLFRLCSDKVKAAEQLKKLSLESDIFE